jgi:hypothetical protein
MARTPAVVLITVGHMEQMAIANRAAGSDFWKSISPKGSHASGEIGRRICMTGSNMRLSVLETPNSRPSGVPIRAPSRNPCATRTRL